MIGIGRIPLIAAGTLSMALGVVGIFVPLLPATPFLLLAAFCYARSSARFHRWLVQHRWFGEYIRAYHEKRGLSRRDKAVTIALLWLSLIATAALNDASWPVRGALLAVAVGVTVHILVMRTAKRRNADPADLESKRRSGLRIESE